MMKEMILKKKAIRSTNSKWVAFSTLLMNYPTTPSLA